MERYKMSKLLNNSTVSSGQYSVDKNIMFKTSTLRSELSDYGNAYIDVNGIITATGTNNVNKRNKKVTFKNNVQFRS